MQTSARIAFVFTAALLLAACAGVQAAPEDGSARPALYGVHEVDTAPELMGCGAAADLPIGADDVALSYVVSASGHVEPGSIRVIGVADMPTSRLPAVSEAEIDHARRIAASCVYTPAMIAGEPVRVRVSKSFL